MDQLKDDLDQVECKFKVMVHEYPDIAEVQDLLGKFNVTIMSKQIVLVSILNLLKL